MLPRQMIRKSACALLSVCVLLTSHGLVLPAHGSGEPDLSAAIQFLISGIAESCSCCSLDQICDSCTYQRMRCKDNLGIFRSHLQDLADRVVDFAFVNIREQCAWVHADRPQEATLKAISLIRASLAGAHEMSHPTVMFEPIGPSAVILGSGKAGQYCHSALEEIGISAQRSGYSAPSR